MTDFMDLDDNMEKEVWDRCFLINVQSHLWLMHAAKKHLEESEGTFVITASVAGVKPSGSSLVCLSFVAGLPLPSPSSKN